MSMDFDSPWKDFLEQFLPSILELCFPRIAAQIDWSKSFDFLDKELQELLRDSLRGRQYVDKLVQVFLKGGSSLKVYLHLEVQHSRDTELEERIFRYHIRLVEKYGPEVASLVILADQDNAWRPHEYFHEILDCSIRFRFPTCKLKDLTANQDALLNSPLPSSIVILADWVAQHTRNKPSERYRWKIKLVRALYEKGLQRDDVVRIFTLADWLLPLEPQDVKQFHREVIEIETEKRMPYINSIERLSREEGIQEGIERGIQQGVESGLIRQSQKSILQIIKFRFKVEDTAVAGAIEEITDIHELDRLFEAALQCSNHAEFSKNLFRT
ncbi:MAG: cytosolic protein [Verrucomicrobiales bacterium]